MKHIRLGKSQKQLRNIMTKILRVFTSLFSRRFSTHVLVILACMVFISSPAYAAEIARDGLNTSIAPVPIEKVKSHYKDCLSEKEIDELIRLKKKLEDMESMKTLDPNLKIEKIIKDNAATDALCDKLPSILKAIKYARELGKLMDKHVRVPKYKKELARAYRNYIEEQVKVNFCEHFRPLDDTFISPTVAKSTGMTWKQLQGLYLRAAKQYCRDMEDLRTKISEFENRCLTIPNLIGLTYDTSLEVAPNAGFTAPLIQQADIKKLHADQRAPMIIYKQDPEPGELRPALFAIKVWLRNDLKSLKAEPPSWKDAKVGETKPFIITVEFLNGKKKVTKDCTWSSTATGVVSMTSTKGVAKATGPGKAEIVALYKFNGGMKRASCEVRIPVIVLAAAKPPETGDKRKKLLTFKLVPQGPIDITIGQKPYPLKAVATFSDQPGKKLNVSKDCKPWKSDGKPDLTVTKGLVEAHSVTLSPKKHVVHATYSYKGQTMDDSVLFRIIGSATPTAEYVKLTLSKSDITMKLQSVESIRATALYSKIPHLFPKDVTFDPHITWSSSKPSMAEFVNGVITSKTSVGSCVITATFNPPGAKKVLTAHCKVTIKGQPLVVDFNVAPKEGPYSPRQNLTFTERIKAHDKSKYNLTWYIENRVVTNRNRIEHAFQAPGKYRVRLVARHRTTGVEDAIAKNIDVEYPPDMEVEIRFRPETNVYKIGSTVGFVAKTRNVKGITEYRWYVSGKYVGSGRDSVKHKFTAAGEYEVKLGLRMGSNVDEVTTTRALVVGETGIGPLGRWRNRFEARGAPEDLVIRSSYWIGGKGKWSKPTTFNGGSIGAVERYILYDGEQADGWNTGYLVYAPRGSDQLLFKVFHFRWPANPKIGPSPCGTVHYSGQLPLHNKKPLPESVHFTRKASRLCEVEWRTEDGSSCRVRISKFKTGKYLQFTGVDDFGCEEGVYEPVADLAELLVSGTYHVSTPCMGVTYQSVWRLNVTGGRISGKSEWTCCPGPRIDPMKGRISGDTVVIERDCTGQGQKGPCHQVYTGKLNGDVIEGSFTLNGKIIGSWTLYLKGDAGGNT